jgi:[protein-PII] uridylyltransferase
MERCEWFRARLRQEPPPGLSPDEIESHCSAMPPHYWERVTEEDLVWGLEAVHGFLSLVASSHTAPTTPFMQWRQTPVSGCTRILLCTWDRRGLLAKAAAAFSAMKMNILRAAAFTRSDHIVLDDFAVADADGRGAVDENRLHEVSFLVEGALQEPPRFASIWACSRHKWVAPPDRQPALVSLDNVSSPMATLVHIQATDRLGLLYDVLQTVADAGLDVTEAGITTERGRACDVIHVVDEQRQKLTDAARLASLQGRLESALG